MKVCQAFLLILLHLGFFVVVYYTFFTNRVVCEKIIAVISTGGSKMENDYILCFFLDFFLVVLHPFYEQCFFPHPFIRLDDKWFVISFLGQNYFFIIIPQVHPCLKNPRFIKNISLGLELSVFYNILPRYRWNY